MKIVFTNDGTQPETLLEKGPFDSVFIKDYVIFGVLNVVPVDTPNVFQVGSHTNGIFEVDGYVYNKMTVEAVAAGIVEEDNV